MRTKPRLTHVTTAEEREFQREQIDRQRDRYLATDVLHRVSYDRGYAAKVALIEEALSGIDGWVLDVGSNTCGEAEVLSAHGHRVIAMDINEVALAISQQRVATFGRQGPMYVSGDAQSIPLRDQEVSAVVCYEALHHLHDPRQALREIYRVLKPGGRLFFFEPYSYNPYRRLSEIRDWMRGTIEKSFGRREIRSLLDSTGFDLVSLTSKMLPPSEWKRTSVGPLWWRLRVLYHRAGRAAPGIFGNLCGIARKPGSTLGGSERPAPNPRGETSPDPG